jgi:hypothetical protein
MLKAEFFGAEPILLDKIIFYTESEGMGKYVYESAKLANVITGYEATNNYTALEQVLRELFWICNEGRRPWSLEAEQSFLALASAGYDLLNYLRAVGKISNDTYAFIDPLNITLRLEQEAEHLQEPNSQVDGDRWNSILAIFYRLIHIYISSFDCWVSDFSQIAKLPAIDTMKYLLETGNDSDFAILLTAFAKTKDLKAEQILIDFTDDDEEPVRALVEKLRATYF